jgi:hypothetical protein
MSSLTNQTSSTKSMSGLSDTYSTNIVCDTFQCDLQFTISPGCVISLPNNSIPDAALSTNVALLNRNPQTFTGVNNFNTNTFQKAIEYFVSPSGTTSTSITQSNVGFTILNEDTSQFIRLQTRFGGVPNTNIFCEKGNMAYLQGNLLNRITVSQSDPATISIQAPALSNDFSIANTAWINTKLVDYALLAGGAGQTFTGIHNFPTPATSTNTTQVATTAYVKSNLLDYVTLATSQTISGFKQFSTRPIFQQGIQANQNIVCESIGGGGQQSIIVQDNAGLNILNVANSNSINLQTRTSGGVNVVNLSCANGTTTTINGTLTMANGDIRCVDGANFTQLYQAGLQLAIVPNHNSSIVSLYTRTAGGVLNENIRCATGNSTIITGDTGNTLTVSASTTPTISIQPLSASNTNEIATTQWTKTQLSGYATLNLNNTFNGTNNFTKSVEFRDVAPTAPVVVRNTVSSNSGGLLISGAGSYNGINNAGDYVVLGLGPSIDNGILNLTTWATGTSGIKITNNAVKQYNPFECAYLQTSPANTTKTNYNIGYRWTIAGTAFTNWAGFVAPNCNNLTTIVWDGTGDKTLGVWSVEVSVGTESTTTAIETLLCWNTTSAVFRLPNRTSAISKGTAQFLLTDLNIIKLNFTMNITGLTDTYYLNFMSRLGAGLAIDTDSSFIRFTRIA